MFEVILIPILHEYSFIITNQSVLIFLKEIHFIEITLPRIYTMTLDVAYDGGSEACRCTRIIWRDLLNIQLLGRSPLLEILT